MASPILMFHYGKVLPWIAKGTDVSSTLLKVGVDQTIFAPLFITFLFWTLSKIQGLNGSEAWNDSTSKIWGALKVNWCIWPVI